MQTTIVDTPIFGRMAHWVARLFLVMTGWKLENLPPEIPKFVLILVPHTSNWDFAYSIAMILAFRLRISWMGKASLFKGPFGPLMRWLGGIPIDRQAAHNVAKHAIQLFRDNETLILALAPEGTRRRVTQWKKGFYVMAKGAGVPVACAFLDYKRKRGGFGPIVLPTNNEEADFKRMYDFYATITPKRPDEYVVPGPHASE